MARFIPLRKRLPLTVRTVFLLLFVGVICLGGAAAYTAFTIEQHTETMLGTRLEYIARTAALVIDGDAHLKLKQSLANNEDISQLEDLSKIQRILRRIQKVNDLSSDLYTFVSDDTGNGLRYLATSADRSYAGKTAALNASAKEAILSGRATHTALYQERNGRWISAYAPIKTKVGRVVGAVAVESRADDEIAVSREKLLQVMAIPAGGLLVLLIIIGWTSASGTSRPLRQLRAALENDAPEAIPASLTDGRRDEIGNLAHAAARALERFQAAKKAADEATPKQEAPKEESRSTAYLLLEEKLKEAERYLHSFTHTLREGLLFFQKDGIILPTYSLACEDLFETMPATKPIWEVLGVPEEEMKDHLAALFQEPIPFEDAAALCPKEHESPSGKKIALRYAPVRDEARRVSAVALAATPAHSTLASAEPTISKKPVPAAPRPAATFRTPPPPTEPEDFASPDEVTQIKPLTLVAGAPSPVPTPTSLPFAPPPPPEGTPDGDSIIDEPPGTTNLGKGPTIISFASVPWGSVIQAPHPAPDEPAPVTVVPRGPSTAQILAPLKLLRYRHQLSQYMRSAREVFIVLRRELDAAQHRIPNLELALQLAKRLRVGGALFGLRPLATQCGVLETRIRALKDSTDEGRTEAVAQLESGFFSVESAFKEALGELWEILGDELETGSRVMEIPYDKLAAFRDRLASIPGAQSLLEDFEEDFLMEPIRAFFTHFDPLVAETANAARKEIRPIVWSGGDLRINAEPFIDLFASMGCLFENAVEHGIEKPEDRKSLDKDPTGTIVVTFQLTEGSSDLETGWLFITIEDDGRGIHPQEVRHQLESTGKATESESDHQVIQHIFDPGYSTKAATEALGASGNGMDALVEQIKRLGGTLEVESVPGRNTQVTILVPYRKRDSQGLAQLAA